MGVGGNEMKLISLDEVAKHNEARGDNKSIWLVIHDKVYDVTKFLDEVSMQKVIQNVVNVPLYSILEAKKS